MFFLFYLIAHAHSARPSLKLDCIWSFVDCFCHFLVMMMAALCKTSAGGCR